MSCFKIFSARHREKLIFYAEEEAILVWTYSENPKGDILPRLLDILQKYSEILKDDKVASLKSI